MTSVPTANRLGSGTEQTQGPRCATGSMLPARCDLCFQQHAAAVQMILKQPAGFPSTQSVWVCPDCAEKVEAIR